MFTVDHFLSKGSMHQICEDYIISNNGIVPYIILSDGCSSSKNTDVGARILVHIARRILISRLSDKIYDNNVSLDYDIIGNEIIFCCENNILNLGLRRTSLDGTLIIAYVYNNMFYVYMYGDGYLITKNKDGIISYKEVNFTNNAPYYLSYRIDKEREYIYKNHIGENALEIKFIDSLYFEYNHPLVFSFPVNDISILAISSDGINTFINKETGKAYSITEIISDISAYKNYKGEFVKRRMNKFIKNMTNKNFYNCDDISIGAFNCEI